MSNPKISVIVPVYNVQKYLAECIESIINQTLQEIEIICVNDGSTDNSLQILKEYDQKDARIKIIDKENQGQGYARKVGLDIAKGKYILFLDSDDKYISNSVFCKLYDYMENSDFDICIFDFSYWRGKITIPKYYDYDKEHIIFKKSMWSTNNKIYRKSFLDKYDNWYFPIKRHLTQDAPLHVQVLVRANNIGYIHEPMFLYRDNNNSATHAKDLSRMLAPCIYIRKTHEVINELITDNAINQNKKEQLKREFIVFTIDQLLTYLNFGYRFNISPIEYIEEYQKMILELKNEFDLYIEKQLSNLTDEQISFYNAMTTLKGKDLYIYFERKKYQEQANKIQVQANKIQVQANKIQAQANKIQAQANKIQVQQLIIKQLQHSKSYRIGRLIVDPLSMPIKVYRLIRDYNLLKKSDLFDTEYYLAKNEDVQKAKMNPILHYLRFGWKEGRNPSEQFDSKAYLNQRPDVKVAGICPLIHYLKFGKK